MVKPVTAPIIERRDRIVSKLQRLNDRPDDRYRFLIDLGRKLSPMAENKKLDEFLVPGCISKVWLFPEFQGNRLFFHADADAAIPKGIVALILEIYNNQSAEDIYALPLDFIDKLDMKSQLSFNRRNSVGNFIERIRHVAKASLDHQP